MFVCCVCTTAHRTTYASADVVFLQEVAAAFAGKALADEEIAKTFYVLKPAKLGRRDQNSMMLLRKSTFPSADTTFTEVTAQVEAQFQGKKAGGLP